MNVIVALGALVGVRVGVREGGMNWVGVAGSVAVGVEGVAVKTVGVYVTLGRLVTVASSVLVGSAPLSGAGARARAMNPAQ